MEGLFSECPLVLPLVCKLLINIFFPHLLELVQAASLGVASQILVTIAASDHAHGVFEFSSESLFVSGTEPEDGHSTVVLNVSILIFSLLNTFSFNFP